MITDLRYHSTVIFLLDPRSEPTQNQDNLQVQTQINVINIDSVDPLHMIVTLTIEVNFTWYDKRLSFSNPSTRKDNVIPSEIVGQLWTPFRSLIHENAILGEIIHDSQKNMRLISQVAEEPDASKVIEGRIFNGSRNSLQLTQRLKIKYNCIFNVMKFPFDGENCSYHMKINQNKNSIEFIDGGDIIYNSTANVDQFLIGDMVFKIENTKEYTRYRLIIPLNRIFTNQLLTTFIPTLILWLFGYSTLFIDIQYPNDRFMGAGTALLVTVTLLNAITDDLPKTSYIKYIDLWFVWHLLSILCITAYHILLGRMQKHFETLRKDQVVPFKSTDCIKLMRKNAANKITMINNSFILLFPVLNSLFYAIYFSITCN